MKKLKKKIKNKKNKIQDGDLTKNKKQNLSDLLKN